MENRDSSTNDIEVNWTYGPSLMPDVNVDNVILMAQRLQSECHRHQHSGLFYSLELMLERLFKIKEYIDGQKTKNNVG